MYMQVKSRRTNRVCSFMISLFLCRQKKAKVEQNRICRQKLHPFLPQKMCLLMPFFPPNSSHLEHWKGIQKLILKRNSFPVELCCFINFSFPAQRISFEQLGGRSINRSIWHAKTLTCWHSGPPKPHWEDSLVSVQLVVPQNSYVPIKSALPLTSTSPAPPPTCQRVLQLLRKSASWWKNPRRISAPHT